MKSDDGGKVRRQPWKVIISGPRPVVAKRRLHSMCSQFGIDHFFSKLSCTSCTYLRFQYIQI